MNHRGAGREATIHGAKGGGHDHPVPRRAIARPGTGSVARARRCRDRMRPRSNRALPMRPFAVETVLRRDAQAGRVPGAGEPLAQQLRGAAGLIAGSGAAVVGETAAGRGCGWSWSRGWARCLLRITSNRAGSSRAVVNARRACAVRHGRRARSGLTRDARNFPASERIWPARRPRTAGDTNRRRHEPPATRAAGSVLHPFIRGK
jgi:hypothetical protein